MAVAAIWMHSPQSTGARKRNNALRELPIHIPHQLTTHLGILRPPRVQATLLCERRVNRRQFSHRLFLVRQNQSTYMTCVKMRQICGRLRVHYVRGMRPSCSSPQKVASQKQRAFAFRVSLPGIQKFMAFALGLNFKAALTNPYR